MTATLRMRHGGRRSAPSLPISSLLDQRSDCDYEQSTGMTTKNKRQRTPLLLFALALALICSIAWASDWIVLRPQGTRPYVTFANVAQFYQFPDYTRVSRTVSLRSDRRVIRAQAGTSEISINGV